MIDVKALYKEFWAEFHKSIIPNDIHLSGETKQVHGNLGYIEFPKCFGDSFKLRATLSGRAGIGDLLNQTRIRAEFKTSRILGVGFVQDNKQKILRNTNNTNSTKNGSTVRWQVTSEHDAKIELEWVGAEIGNRKLWPVHHAWLRISLHDLADTFVDHVLHYEANHR
jgi:hypothetical protein